MSSYFKSYVQAIVKNDPASRGALEAILCYPGLRALMLHRFSSFLWRNTPFKLLARIISDFGRMFTGIEIHPGAVIGKGVFIDHGMGVVIGETAIVEDGVILFHGVTLGGRGHEKNGKRHPTVKVGSIIGAHATILGPITIGTKAVVGACTLVLKDVDPFTTVVGGNIPRIIHK